MDTVEAVRFVPLVQGELAWDPDLSRFFLPDFRRRVDTFSVSWPGVVR